MAACPVGPGPVPECRGLDHVPQLHRWSSSPPEAVFGDGAVKSGGRPRLRRAGVLTRRAEAKLKGLPPREEVFPEKSSWDLSQLSGINNIPKAPTAPGAAPHFAPRPNSSPESGTLARPEAPAAPAGSRQGRLWAGGSEDVLPHPRNAASHPLPPPLQGRGCPWYNRPSVPRPGDPRLTWQLQGGQPQAGGAGGAGRVPPAAGPLPLPRPSIFPAPTGSQGPGDKDNVDTPP